jgi:hypothetical protein
MPLFLCRWPNGDCSVVWARNKEEAILELDQVGNAEGCPVAPMRTFQAHFTLTDRRELVVDGLGEGTREEILEGVYPVLDQALSDAYDGDAYDCYEKLPKARRAAIARAVEQERNRIDVDETRTTEPQTELGRDLKQQTDLPTVFIDRAVRQAARKRLRKFQGRAKPS